MGFGESLGRMVGGELKNNMLAKQINPLRQALLNSQPYDGPMASLDSQQAALNAQAQRTPQQQMIMAAAQDPKLFARTAGSPEGALTLAGGMKAPGNERDIVVNADSDRNKQYNLGLTGDQTAIITQKYDAQDHALPGFTLKSFHDPKDTNGGKNDPAAVATVKSIEARRIAAGQPAFTPQEYESQLLKYRETTRSTQEYNAAQDQFVRGGGDPMKFPSFEQWTPSWTSQVRVALAGADQAVKDFSALKTKAQDAQSQLQNLSDMNDLLSSGAMNAGAAANQRTALGRVFDTLLNRPPSDNASAYTDAYIASSGRQVGKNIRLFGAGTGLSDADREFAKIMSGADVTMTPEALRLIAEINTRGALGDIKRYNDAYDYAAKTPEMAMLAKTNQPISIEDYQMGPLQKAPDGLTPQQKIDFYLKQRPSYAAQPAAPGVRAPQLPPAGSAPPAVAPQVTPGQIIQYDAQGRHVK